jgi:radical SAM-linked protein
VCEYLDIKIDREMSCDDIKHALSMQFPVDMKVLDVYEPTSKFSDAVYSGYTIEIFDPSIDQWSTEKLKNVFSQPEIKIVKRSKSGDKEVNIIPYIYSYDMKSTDGKLVFNTVLSASSADYLNPEYVVNVIYDSLSLSKNIYSDEYGYNVTRTELYTTNCNNVFR